MRLRPMKPAAVLFFALLCPGLVMGEGMHFIGPTGSGNESVSSSTMDTRIKRAAGEYRQYAPIPRVAFFDIGYPEDAEEYKALDGFGIVLISALSQISEELPPKRVYVTTGRGTVQLRLIRSVSSTSGAATLTAKVFGNYRWDGLYLFPAYLRRDGQEMLIDYAKNREGFVLTKMPGLPMPEYLRDFPITAPASSEPDASALRRFVAREFPALAEKTIPPSR